MAGKKLYDIVLKGGRVIDPAQGIDGIRDVGIKDGKIAAVKADLKGSKKNIDVRGKIVLPGMIDSHAHVFQHVSGRFGLNPDMAGVHSGVTTLVDQGGPSCMTFPSFRKFIVEPAKTRVLAFISIYVVGGREGHRPGGTRKRRPGEGHQVSCGNRRVRALGPGCDETCGQGR